MFYKRKQPNLAIKQKKMFCYVYLCIHVLCKLRKSVLYDHLNVHLIFTVRINKENVQAHSFMMFTTSFPFIRRPLCFRLKSQPL